MKTCASKRITANRLASGACLSLSLALATRADLGRVNVGVYGGLVTDIAAMECSGTSVVFAAVECNRGLFRWNRASNDWSTVTWPDVVGNGYAVEANPSAGHESDLYAILVGSSGENSLYSSSAAGSRGSWVIDTKVANPAVLQGHTTGMYLGTRDGGLYYNSGAAGDAFVHLHSVSEGEIQSVAPVNSSLIYVAVRLDDGLSNALLRLEGTMPGAYTEAVVPQPSVTASGVGSPITQYIAVDPDNTNRLIAAGSDNAAANPQVYESTDGGATWGRSWDHGSASRFPGAHPFGIKFSAGRVFVSGCALAEGSNTWSACEGTETDVGAADGSFVRVFAHANSGALEVDPVDPAIVYLGTDWAIGAATCTVAGAWSRGVEIEANSGLEGVVLNDLDFYSYSPTSKVVWVAAKSGIGRTRSFDPADPSSTSSPYDWIFPLYPDGAPAQSIAIHPTNPAVVLAGYNSGRVFRSEDATAESATNIHWVQTFDSRPYSNVFSTVENDVVITSIGFVPSSSDEVYMGGHCWSSPVTNGGVFYSSDQGATWSCVASGFPVNVLYVNDDAVWAGVGDRDSAARGLRARVSATHWWAPSSGMPLDSEIVRGLAGTTIGLTSTVYVATEGGVYKGVKAEPSSGGFSAWSWTDLTAAVGASDTNFRASTVDPADADHAYVASGNSIYETVNGGASWTRVSGTGVPTHEDVRALCYDDLLLGTDTGLYAFAPAGAPAADTDGDGLSDDDEASLYGTDPGLSDTDSDGLSDGEEVLTCGTDPTAADTDSDGACDGDEVDAGTDPSDAGDYPDTSSLGRVNLGVYGAQVKDLATLPRFGRTRVFAAVEGNRGVFRWQGFTGPRAHRWASVTWPAIVGKGRAVEVNPAAGHSQELYAIISGTDSVHRLYASASYGNIGSWSLCPSAAQPCILAGHSSGMYAATFDGRILYNAGGTGDSFTELYNKGRQIASLAPVSPACIYFTCTNFTAGVTNLFRLDWTGSGFAETALPLPASTASGTGLPIVTIAAVDPDNTNRVIAAGSDQAAADPQVYESLDGGLTWGRCWARSAGGVSNFPGAYPHYIKFDSGRLFVSACALAAGSDAWTHAVGSETTIGTAAGGSSLISAHVNSGALDVDPLDPTIVYHDTDWALCSATCTVAGAWSVGREIGANHGLEAVVLNDMDFQADNATNKWLWVAAKSGLGRALHFNPADPASTATPFDWIFPVYPCNDGAPLSTVAMQPGHPELVLAGNGAGKIYRSEDATNMTYASIHWSQVFSSASFTNVFHTAQNDVWLTSVGFVPSTPSEAYFGGFCWSAPVSYGGVFRSTDSGATWSCVASGFPVNVVWVSDRAVWAGVGSPDSVARGLRVKQSPTHWWAPTSGMSFDNEVITGISGTSIGGTDTVYLVSQGGVYKGVLPPSGSSFADWVWTDLTAAVGAADTSFTSAAVDPADALHAYVASGNCIYETLDGGALWSLLSGTGTPWHEDVRVLCYDDLLVGTDDGLYASEAAAALYFVDAASASPAAPYGDWDHAAHTIQEAVRAAPAGATVYVRAGTYDSDGDAAPGGTLVNRLCATNGLTIRGVDGAEATLLVGAGPCGPSAVRCAYLSGGSTLEGFTLVGGHTAAAGDTLTEQSGGGAFVAGDGALSGCRLVLCEAAVHGGGALLHGGGSVCGSAVASNSAAGNGAGVCLYHGGAVSESKIGSNTATGAASCGGGAHCEAGGALVNCEVTGNSTPGRGGGVSLSAGGCVSLCTVVGNAADTDSNGAGSDGGGVFVLNGGTNRNSILYFNTRKTGTVSNWGVVSPPATFDHCCTTPSPGGVGTVTADPKFVAVSQGNFALKYGSPCVDAGVMQTDLTLVDLGGASRPIKGNFAGYPDYDIGAWEYNPSVSDSDGDGADDGWEHSYGLSPAAPEDAAADADGDGFPNGGEFVAGTDPTNAVSRFVITQAERGEAGSGFTVRWNGVAGRLYTVTRMSDLQGSDAAVLSSNVTGSAYTDTDPVAAARFYRIGVRLEGK